MQWIQNINLFVYNVKTQWQVTTKKLIYSLSHKKRLEFKKTQAFHYCQVQKLGLAKHLSDRKMDLGNW